MIVNVSLATDETYIFPLASSAAAVAVNAVKIGCDAGNVRPDGVTEAAAMMPDLSGVTTVVAELTVSVTVPVAFDRPAANCCKDRMTFFGSVSLSSGT